VGEAALVQTRTESGAPGVKGGSVWSSVKGWLVVVTTDCRA